jgi:hypothetical protein
LEKERKLEELNMIATSAQNQAKVVRAEIAEIREQRRNWLAEHSEDSILNRQTKRFELRTQRRVQRNKFLEEFNNSKPTGTCEYINPNTGRRCSSLASPHVEGPFCYKHQPPSYNLDIVTYDSDGDDVIVSNDRTPYSRRNSSRRNSSRRNSSRTLESIEPTSRPFVDLTGSNPFLLKPNDFAEPLAPRTPLPAALANLNVRSVSVTTPVASPPVGSNPFLVKPIDFAKPWAPQTPLPNPFANLNVHTSSVTLPVTPPATPVHDRHPRIDDDVNMEEANKELEEKSAEESDEEPLDDLEEEEIDINEKSPEEMIANMNISDNYIHNLNYAYHSQPDNESFLENPYYPNPSNNRLNSMNNRSNPSIQF